MSRSVPLVSLFAAAALTACAADSTTDLAFETEAPRVEKADAAGIAVESFQASITTDVRIEGGLAILTSADKYEDYLGTPAPASIDFDTEWVAFYGIGAQNSGGYSATIEAIEFYPMLGGLVVHTKDVSPGLDCLTTKAITFPYTLVKFSIPSPQPVWYSQDHVSQVNDCFEPADVLQARLAESLEAWQAMVADNGSSYTYTRDFFSFLGFSFQTTFVIEDGEIVERHYKAQHTGGGDAVQWSETGEELGSHSEGHALMVIDDLYENCANDVLTVDQSENRLNLFIDSDTGLLQDCSYFPRNCADDCSRGVNVSSVDFAN